MSLFCKFITLMLRVLGKHRQVLAGTTGPLFLKQKMGQYSGDNVRSFFLHLQPLGAAETRFTDTL